MGRRDSEMAIKVYSKFVENMRGTENGAALNQIFQGLTGTKE